MSVPSSVRVVNEGACIVLEGSADNQTYRDILLSARYL